MRDEAEEKAWDSLARGKFWMFGYYAARRVSLNSLLKAPDKTKSPFRDLVKKAQERRKSW